MWKDELEGNPGRILREQREFGVEGGKELECCYSESLPTRGGIMYRV